MNSFFYFSKLFLLYTILFFAPNIYSQNKCATLFIDQSKLLNSTDSIKDILSSMRRGSGAIIKVNPTSIDIYSISEGQEFYVMPTVFKRFASIIKKLKTPIKIKVVQIVKKSKKKTWGKNWDTIYVQSPETGIVGIELWQLSGYAYSKLDFSYYSPFEKGEYVQIGYIYSLKNIYKVVDQPDTTVSFEGSSALYIGKFVGIYDANNYVIEVKSMHHHVMAQIIVPKKQTFGLTNGTALKFENAVQGLLKMNIPFKPYERVRYRANNGKIYLGSFLRTNGIDIKLINDAGQFIYASPESVSKYLGGEPYTASYNADWIIAIFRTQDPLVKKLLDGALKLSSMKDFIEQTPENRILILMKYLKTNLTWTKGAISCENAGLSDFNEIIASGAGVCRHLSPLLATILSELGYTPRVTKYKALGDQEGHAWLEVDIKLDDGNIKTFVVDPSNGDYIKDFGQVIKIGRKNRNSSEFKFYMQSNREYLLAD